MWRSKKLWAFGTIGGGIASSIVYDRRLSEQDRKECMASAKRLGEEPVGSDGIKNIFVMTSAPSASALSDINSKWQKEVVPLITAAGVDYKILAVNLGKINRQLHEGPAESAVKKVATAQSWMRPMVQDALSIEYQLEADVESIWKSKINRDSIHNGIICLDKDTFESVKDLPLKVYFIDCDSPLHWSWRIYERIFTNGWVSKIAKDTIKMLMD